MAQLTNSELVENLKPFFVSRREWHNKVLEVESGEITSIIAGDGLTGGGSSGAVTINAVAATNSGLTMNTDDMTITLQSPSGLELAASGLAVADSLAGAGLSIAGKVLSVTSGGDLSGSTGDGLVWDAGNSEIDLGTPSTLTTATTNAVTASSHTHEITTTSSGSGSPSTILQSDSSGDLSVRRIWVDDLIRHQADTDTYLQFDADVFKVYAGGANNVEVQSTSVLINNSLGIGVTPTVSLDISYTGTGTFFKHTGTIGALELDHQTAQADPYNIGVDTSQLLDKWYWKLLQGTYNQVVTFADAPNANATVFGVSTSSDGGSTWYPGLAVKHGGNVGIGLNNPTASVHIRKTTTPQVWIDYDASKRTYLQTNSAGTFTLGADTDVILTAEAGFMWLNTAQDIIVNATGQNVRPNLNWDTDIGSLTKLWRTIYAAELYVQTIVAQDVVSTIGGRILVGPTTKLTRDLDALNWFEKLSNTGFETLGGGSPDVFASWTEVFGGTGSINDETTNVHTGSHACRADSGDAVSNTYVYQTRTVGSEHKYWLRFYTRGDGTNDGDYAVYDVTNAAYIISQTATGVTGTTYTLVAVWFKTPANCVSIQIEFYAPIGVSSASAYYDNASMLDGSMWVEHNEMAVNDTGLLQTPLQGEYVLVGDGPTLETAGDYLYGVYRNQDASGLNDWIAGDAVFNTGTTGDGFIDLYSGAGLKEGVGPTIVGNVRNSTTYNDYDEHFAIGNLENIYGYGTATYGVALGRYSTTKTYVTIDDTSGMRIYSNNVVRGQWDIAGNITVGDTANENIQITPTAVNIRDGTTQYTQLAAGVLTLGVTTTDHVRISSSVIELKDGSTVRGQWQTDGDIFIGSDISAAATTYLSVFAVAQTYNSESVEAGDMLIGDNSASKANIFWDKSAGILYFRGGTTGNVYIDTAGSLVAGTGLVWLDDSGLSLEADTTYGHSEGSVNFLSPTQYRGGSQITLGTIEAYEFQNGFNAAGIKWLLDYAPSGGTDPFISLDSSDQFSDSTITIEAGAVGVNANGLTIDQDAADSNIIRLLSSDIAHGITSLDTTDTYGYAAKFNATEGGLRWMGISESVAALILNGTATSDNTTKTSSALAPVRVISRKKSGTGTTDVGTNGNMFVIAKGGTSGAVWFVDVEGDTYRDGSSNTFDEHDDLALARTFDVVLQGPGYVVDEEFDNFLQYNASHLLDLGILHGPGEDGHYWYNRDKLQRLQNGALFQLMKRNNHLEKRVTQLESVIETMQV